MNTVLPERLSPVTASQTVAPPARSLRLPASRSEACTTIGGSQLKFIMDVIRRASRVPVPSGPKVRRPQVAGNVDAGRTGVVASVDARPARSGTRIFRPVRLLGDDGRAGLDRLQRPSQHGLLQRAVRPRRG